ncbi:MAG: hypothetical protein KGL39_26620 [Patescibacteria group bacterium]|nr:hypothetical protein [Patescibacteria group bacterium]
MSKPADWKEAWAAHIRAAAGRLGRFVETADSAGTRVNPTAWTAIKAALSQLKLGEGTTFWDDSRGAFDNLDAMDRAMASLERAVLLAGNPEVIALAGSSMSLTYVGELKGDLRVAERELDAARRVKPIAVLREPATAFIAEYNERDRGELSTAVFVSALDDLKLPPHELKQILEPIKQRAVLGSRAAAEEVSMRPARAYHPLQQLCVVPSASEPASGPAAVDLTVPGATTAIDYDVAPLIDKEKIREYGPLATSVTGLNYKLVQRLKTIRERPVKEAKNDASDTERRRTPWGSEDSAERTATPADKVVRAGERLTYTNDGGETTRAFLPLPRDWRPAPAAYTESYHELCAGALLENPLGPPATPAKMKEAAMDALSRYRADGQADQERKMAVAPTDLAKALIERFEEDYAVRFPARPPANIRAMRERLEPPTAAVPRYIMRAVTDAAYPAFKHATIRRAELSRAGYIIARTELIATFATTAFQAARVVMRRLRDAWPAVTRGGDEIEAIPAPADDAGLGAWQRHADAVRAVVARMIRDVAKAATKNETLSEALARPSFKTFVLLDN